MTVSKHIKDAVRRVLKVSGTYDISLILFRSSRQLFRDIRQYYRHIIGCSKARRITKHAQPIRLELGGGNQCKDGWINVDISPNAELTLDLLRPLPFQDCSIDAIYSEHVLEHFSHPQGLSGLLAECYRVLKVGGEFLAAVPDFEKAARLYVAGDEDAFYKEKHWASPSPNWCKNTMDELNWFIYMDGLHKFMFDGKNVLDRLAEAGFCKPCLREFDPAVDSGVRRRQSIYVKAVK